MPYRTANFAMDAMGAGAEKATDTLSIGENTVTHNMTVVFELK